MRTTAPEAVAHPHGFLASYISRSTKGANSRNVLHRLAEIAGRSSWIWRWRRMLTGYRRNALAMPQPKARAALRSTSQERPLGCPPRLQAGIGLLLLLVGHYLLTGIATLPDARFR